MYENELAHGHNNSFKCKFKQCIIPSIGKSGVALKRTDLGLVGAKSNLLGGGVLGDSLGTLRHGVLGQLTGQEEPDSGLDLPRGDGAPLVVVSET